MLYVFYDKLLRRNFKQMILLLEEKNLDKNGWMVLLENDKRMMRYLYEFLSLIAYVSFDEDD